MKKRVTKIQEKSLSDLVRESIDTLPYVKDALRLDILNYSAFARLIGPTIEKQLKKKVRREAIVVASQRYKRQLKETTLSEKLRKLISSTTLSLRADVVDISLKRNIKTQDIINQMMQEIKWEKDEILFVVQGRYEVEVILDLKNFQRFKEKLSEDDIISIVENLVMIIVNQPSGELTFTPGFMHFLTEVLYLNGINLPQFLSTYSDIILIVDNKDASRSYDFLNDAIMKCRKYSKIKE